MTPEEAVRITYDAYNARDLPRALASLSTDVEWDDGAGSMLRGRDAVAAHWREQWRKADARVAIETLASHVATLRLTIRLDVRKPDGSRARQALTNRITFRGGLICAMRIG